jgi:two-component system phosphate regulon response regulator PhoB
MSKILLIEDDDVMVGLLQTLLGIDGYEVVTFRSGEDVLQVVQKEQPDVILIDVNLKNLGINHITGLDLVGLIRSNNDTKHTGVILSSGINYRQESKAAGADGFILKPYMPDDLLKLIEETITNN